MTFGYFPQRNPLKDLFVRVFGYPYLARRMEGIHLFSWLEIKPADKLLDVGGGIGLNALEAAKRGAQVTFIDLSPEVVQRARKNIDSTPYAAAIRTQQDDITRSKLPAATFDKAICHSTLEHIPEDTKALANIAKALKPGGVFYLNVPAASSPMPSMGLFYALAKAFKGAAAIRQLKEKYAVDFTSRKTFEDSFRRNVWVAYHLYEMEATKKTLEGLGFRVVKAEYAERWLATFAYLTDAFLSTAGWPQYVCYPFLILLWHLDKLLPIGNPTALNVLAVKKA